MIQVRSLTKSYGDRLAIHNLSFTVQKGEVVGFLGPNGAGKSTTMKIITGYMAPSSGEVRVGGYDVFENPIEVKSKIGFLPETPPVYTDMRVQEYLEFVARLRGVEKKQAENAAHLAMEKTNLVDVRKRLIGNLSKGFKQRVGLAQALVGDPEVLILDEPTVGLDPKQVHEIRELILKLKGQHTLILSTHILSEVQASCDRIIIINNGQIVAEESLNSLSHKMSGAQQLVLRVRRKADQLQSVLGPSQGVRHLETKGSEIWLQLEQGEEWIEKVSSHLVREDFGLIELRPVQFDLEEAFIRLTSESDQKKGVSP